MSTNRLFVKLTIYKQTVDENNSSINIWGRELFSCIHTDTSISVNNQRLPCFVSTHQARRQFRYTVSHHHPNAMKMSGNEFQHNRSFIKFVLLIAMCIQEQTLNVTTFTQAIWWTPHITVASHTRYSGSNNWKKNYYLSNSVFGITRRKYDCSTLLIFVR